MTKAMPEFEVHARIGIVSGVYIVAESLADAIERAKHMDESDFVKIKGEFHDGTFEVIGVSSKEGWELDR